MSFYKEYEFKFVIIATYVVNIIETCKELAKARDYLKKEFDMKDF